MTTHLEFKVQILYHQIPNTWD